ncbi:MAG: hypothetical protein ACRDZX_13255, partial [Acidimicrobiales bacterium]
MGRRPAWATILVLSLVILGWSTPAPFAPASASSRTSTPHALVLSVSAKPSALPAGGGTVAIKGWVEHATTCQLRLLSRQALRVVYSHAPKRCQGGTYGAHVTVAANPSGVRRSIAFALVARNARSSFASRFFVVLAAPLPAKVMSVSAYPDVVPAHGGQVTVSGRVEHASSCRLELLSKQSFPVVYASNTRPCRSTFTA